MADGPGPASNEKEDWKWEPRVCESSSASPEHSRLGKQAKVLTKKMVRSIHDVLLPALLNTTHDVRETLAPYGVFRQ